MIMPISRSSGFAASNNNTLSADGSESRNREDFADFFTVSAPAPHSQVPTHPQVPDPEPSPERGSFAAGSTDAVTPQIARRDHRQVDKPASAEAEASEAPRDLSPPSASRALPLAVSRSRQLALPVSTEAAPTPDTVSAGSLDNTSHAADSAAAEIVEISELRVTNSSYSAMESVQTPVIPFTVKLSQISEAMNSVIAGTGIAGDLDAPSAGHLAGAGVLIGSPSADHGTSTQHSGDEQVPANANLLFGDLLDQAAPTFETEADSRFPSSTIGEENSSGHRSQPDSDLMTAEAAREFSIQAVSSPAGAAAGRDLLGGQTTPAKPGAEISNQIAPKMIQLISDLRSDGAAQKRMLKIHLRPEDMGAVEITVVRHHSGSVSTRIVTERETASTALNEHVAQLRESLERAGLQVEKLEIDFRPSSSSDMGQGGKREAPSSGRTEVGQPAVVTEPCGIEKANGDAEARLVSLRA